MIHAKIGDMVRVHISGDRVIGTLISTRHAYEWNNTLLRCTVLDLRGKVCEFLVNNTPYGLEVL